jgi:hypothetical protein
VKGIYFSWASDPPNTKIKDWNVAELKIDQNRRHVDKAVVASFSVFPFSRASCEVSKLLHVSENG